MKIEISVDAFRPSIDRVEGVIAAAATGAMRDTMPITKQELREQITSAGLGTRLANTWRGDVYPTSKRSIHPTGLIHSNAPLIIDSFARGAQIVPVNGGQALAIPTKNVPNTRGADGKVRAMTPVEVEAVFNQDLILTKGRNGHLLAFVNAVKGRNGRGFKRATARRYARGRAAQLVLMFTLVRSVRMPKLLDIEGPAKRWAADYAAAVARRLGAP